MIGCLDTRRSMNTFHGYLLHNEQRRLILIWNTCCQLSVTDKGYLYVVPMKWKSEVLAATNQFSKDVGTPDAIVCDMASEQLPSGVKQFCNVVGTMLIALEEGTPWFNKAELYIKLMKEAVRKDMREADSPLPFWD